MLFSGRTEYIINCFSPPVGASPQTDTTSRDYRVTMIEQATNPETFSRRAACIKRARATSGQTAACGSRRPMKYIDTIAYHHRSSLDWQASPPLSRRVHYAL